MPPETATRSVAHSPYRAARPAPPATQPQGPPLPPPQGPPLPPPMQGQPLPSPERLPLPPPRPAAEPALGEPERAGARGMGIARPVSCALLFSVVLVILVAIAGMALGLWRFTVIDTGSMRPALAPGDVAVLTPEPLAELRRGQIVAFHPPGEPRLTVIHRVFAIHRAGSDTVIETKGDANNTTDAWHARLVGDKVWRESTKVPLLGYLSVWSAQRPVRFGLLIAIVMLLVSAMLGAIWRSSPR